jgi:hypothetical protein
MNALANETLTRIALALEQNNATLESIRKELTWQRTEGRKEVGGLMTLEDYYGVD